MNAKNKEREAHKLLDTLDAAEKQSIALGLWKETKYSIQHITKEMFIYFYCHHCDTKYSPDRFEHCYAKEYNCVLKEHTCMKCFRDLEQKECSRQEYCGLFGCLLQRISVVTDHYGVDKETFECRVCRKRNSYIDDD